MLEPETSLSKWQERAQACAGARGFRMRPPEVFDSLLAGDQALLRIDGGSRQWRYSATDPAREGGDPFAQRMEPKEVVLESLSRIEKFLCIALGQDVPQDGASRVFALLAEHYRLLPTSPAVAEVARARTALAGKSERSTTIESHLRVLNDFHAMVHTHLQDIVCALQHATFIGGEELHGGLSLLSQGLGFARKDIRQIVKAINDWRDDLRRFLISRDVPEQATEVLLLDRLASVPWEAVNQFNPEGLQQHLAQVKLDRMTFLRSWTRPEWPQQAWHEAVSRLAEHCRDGKLRDLRGLELLAHGAEKFGPGMELDVVIEQMPLHRWTQLLLRSLEDPRLPAGLAGIALARLGAGNAPPTRRVVLLEAVLRLLPASPDRENLREAVQLRELWRGRQQALGSVLVVCAQRNSFTEQWRRVPERSVALVATLEEMAALIDRHPALVAALPRPLHIVWEQQDASRRRLLMQMMRRRLQRPWHPMSRLRADLYAKLRRARGERVEGELPGPDEMLAKILERHA